MKPIKAKDNPSPELSSLETLRMRLLDLTARNRLINFRHTKNGSLRIIDELPNQLAATLLTNAEMRFLAIPEPTEDELIDTGYLNVDEKSQEIIQLRKPPTANEWAKHLGFDTNYEVPKRSTDSNSNKHADTAIQTLLYPYEMESKLKSLLQTGESAIQEMGANILYLALGFLEWYDENGNGKPRQAPLFLIPIRLHKGRLNTKTSTYEYTLSYSDEDIIPNLSLKEKLRADFGMALPDLDESTVPDNYLRKVQTLIKKTQPLWCVRRYISLTLLNFSKLLMYLDLDPANWPKNANIVDHPIVNRFLGNSNLENDNDSGDLGFGQEHAIDEIDDIYSKYPLIDDADSSQHSALIDAVDGKNLVIEGPPGTGKSQTITNLIAATMAQGKRILFVAEKLAALEVVQRRLDAAGLGDFCLELHSHKSQKSKVLNEIDNRLKKHGKYRRPKSIDVDVARYEELRATLQNHAQRINAPWKNTGKTLNEVFMAATRYRNTIEINPESLHPTGYCGGNYDASIQRRNEDQVEVFRKVYQSIASQLGQNATLKEHPWYGIENTDLQIFDQSRITDSLNEWQKSLTDLNDYRKKIALTLGCDLADITESLEATNDFLVELESLPSLKGDEKLESLPTLRDDKLVKIQNQLTLFIEIQKQYTALSKDVDLRVLGNLEITDQLLLGGGQLKELVSPNVELGLLATGIKALTKIQKQLEQLEAPLQSITEALAPSSVEHLTTGVDGLAEFNIAIKTISSLDPSYWSDRDDIFDNEELDELLPEMGKDLSELKTLHKAVHEVFKLDDFPSDSEILQLRNTLASGKIFCWFKKDWRAARRRVISYAINPQVKLSSLEPLLESFAEFSKKHHAFIGDLRFQKAFGNQHKGLETDITTLESLRKWYKQVRHDYGIGFGSKVALGDAIIRLPLNVSRAIRSLSERGIQQELSDVSQGIKNLNNIFTPIENLLQDNSQLAGAEGAISLLLNALDSSVRDCDPLLTDNSISITKLANQIEQINRLRNKVATWQESNADINTFQKQFDLKLGVHTDNTVGLSSLQHTIELASQIENQLTCPSLIAYIDRQPRKSTFTILRELSQKIQELTLSHTTAYSSFAKLTQLDLSRWSSKSCDHMNALISRNSLALNNVNLLQIWLDYVRIYEQLKKLGLEKLLDSIADGKIDILQVEDAYNAGIYDLLAREILKEEPDLATFSGHTQEALQDKFREYDNKLKKLQREQIAWNIDQADIPIGNKGARVSERTEKTLLEHECSKKKRHIPLRQLLSRSGEALVALKPCFMMGPMSVAQYLSPGKITFDLVIMDEASQIKPQDALGTIARGGQLIVVGDPKQLPPTSFFDRVVDENEDDPTAIEESESILDATLPIFQSRRLRWHYRSQHESLISFSNFSFYDNDLILFPSPHKQNSNYGIQYTRLQLGCFINRRNMEEAKIISEAVREHYQSRTDETLGVVAMNSEQRLQIEAAIETLAKNDFSFRNLLEKDSQIQESLFIKNLENVQGDERDVIFISMTYGPPEPNAKVFQRFGPINSDTGWRRLNVLFTRSRKRMHIFSSMGADDIIIGANSKRGVLALRDFLRFCETGILHATEVYTDRPPDSDFEISVMNALRDKGFKCIPQVGVAGFFIDVAVVDPGNEGRYLLGIECDGATYHSAKSTRDRDRLRQTILERLGWKIHRIWSTDWFKNPEGELVPLIRKLDKLKSIPQTSYETETSKFESILEAIDAEEEQINLFAFNETSLRDRLIRFKHEVILKEHPTTLENSKILRPAMIEALMEYMPSNTVEFLQVIPAYIRNATDANEGVFLEQIFDIINASQNKIQDRN